MSAQELYSECHRLFSYDHETGLLTRKVNILSRGGVPHSMPKTRVGDAVGCDNGSGYLVVRINNKKYYVHRIIWLMVTGALPKGHIDHANRNRADNRLSNLREATFSENLCNKVKSTSNRMGFKGVIVDKRKRKNPYLARIQSNGKAFYIGCFPTPELAHEAYCKASKELHGVFSNTG